MNYHLTDDKRVMLESMLAESGCYCEGDHYEPEDATSLGCLADLALFDLKKLKTLLEDMEDELEDLQAEVGSLRDERDYLQDEVYDIETRMSDMEAEGCCLIEGICEHG